MLKNILSILIGIYIVLSIMYLGYKLFPSFIKYLNNSKYKDIISEKIDKDSKSKKESKQKVCKNFSIGNITSNKTFSLETRFKKTFKKDLALVSGSLNHDIEKATCDIVGDKLAVFHNSKLLTMGIITNYEYTSAVSNKDNSVEIKTLASPISEIDINSGYVVGIYEFDNINNSKLSWELTSNEEKIIVQTCDTIYFELSENKSTNYELEYLGAKTDLNGDGTQDFIVIANWYDNYLPKNVKYTSIFTMLFKQDYSAKRYSLLAFTKTRKSSFYIEQIIDLDNDGFKEIVIKKVRNYIDSFIVFDFLDKKNIFKEL